MMASQPASGDGSTLDIREMSRDQLLEIMYQMKELIDQNPQLARQILIDNPMLTRTVFKAQIMLGMVRPRQQQASSQPQQAQTVQQPNAQAIQSSSVQAGVGSSSQPLVPARPTHSQPSISVSSASIPPLAFQSQTMSSNPPPLPQQTKNILNTQVPSAAPPHSIATHNPPLPPPPAPQYPIPQTHLPITAGLTQQPMQIPGAMHQPLQPPLPQQPRPSSMLPFPHQAHPQMPHNVGYQPSNMPQQHLSQPMFHSGGNPSLPSSFPQGQPPLPNHPPPQQLYQGSSHMGTDFGVQVGNTMQGDRGAPWVHGLPENPMPVTQLPGPPPLPSGQMAPGPGVSGPPQPPQLTSEMERNLLEQVMSLTPEQINLLPPEQRNQVKQLQEMLMVRNR
ncbi:putative cleavage stimulation factor subunit 2, hinge domain-containing protein [Dioscorea sansibarensis]